MSLDKDTSNHAAAAASVSRALRKLLTPLLCMSDSTRFPKEPKDLWHELFEIVNDAGQFSRQIRMCSTVIYHRPPTFKDGMYVHVTWKRSNPNMESEEFDPERMECLNVTSMINNSPYELKKQPNDETRSVLKGATEKSEAIVRVTAFPGLVAHRKGGGHLAKKLLAEEKIKDQASEANLPPDVRRAHKLSAGEPVHEAHGFRTRVICKSVVHLEWGRQRLLTKEAGTSRHLDAMRDGGMAKYEDDRMGFIELFDYFLLVHKDSDRGSG
jgi:hypothetical protein